MKHPSYGPEPSWHRSPDVRRSAALLAAVLLVGGVTATAKLLPYYWPISLGIAGPMPPVRNSLAVSTGEASILFVGDTYFGETYRQGPRRHGLLEKHGYGYPFAHLGGLLRSADIVVANLEGPLSTHTASALKAQKEFIHRGDPQRSTAALAQAGIRAVSLANNHAMDLLEPGLNDTLAALSTAGIDAFGAGATITDAARPFRHTIQVGRHTFQWAVIGAFERDFAHYSFGFFADHTHPGAYGLATPTIEQQLRALKRAAPDQYVVVFPHWGNNYTWRSSLQQALGRAMIDAGADLVVGHGGHVFQEVEPYRDRWILYGIGNFAFLSLGRYHKEDIHPYGMAARLVLADGDETVELSLRLYFIASNNRQTRFQPHLLSGDRFDEAARTLLEQGGLEPAARGVLQQRVARRRDAAGQCLSIELGSWTSGRQPAAQ